MACGKNRRNGIISAIQTHPDTEQIQRKRKNTNESMEEMYRAGTPDYELNADDPDQEEGTFSLISIDDFYDLLMEQQEQM